MKAFSGFSIGVLCSLFSITTHAEIVQAAPDHFTLRHEADSDLTPKQIWRKLKNPGSWWHPDHTYSGSSDNMSIRLKAGGKWREDWRGGSVVHGTVLYVKKGEILRLDAPFGPLQEMAIKDVWAITVTPEGDGAKIVFDEVVNGSSASNLEEMAKAVDFVKQEAIERLAATKIE